jgi:tRNA-specific 2-thiouridylase
VDDHKDQSYVLYTLGQAQLARILFPIGGYTKDEVRDLARKFGLPVAGKKESQDLCFLKDGDYRRFLRDHSLQVFVPGPILDEAGRELGHHEGLANYTIGQRKGLGITAADPLFVLGKDGARNALIVGPREALGQPELEVTGVNWISGRTPAAPVAARVKIRYKATPIGAVITPISVDKALVSFDEPVVGATPGQAAVFYDGPVCLGGGLIAAQVELVVPEEAARIIEEKVRR